MHTKKIIILLPVAVIIAIFLSACGAKITDMGQPAADNNYHYKNSDLGFSLVLPPEFVYYQTQRTEEEAYIDLDIFVPTSDTGYPQAVPGYANPIKLRVLSGDNWDEILEAAADGTKYQKLGEKNGRVYAARFWDAAPADWKDKWSEDMKRGIADGFKIE